MVKDGLRILVTGGAGFIGSALIRHLIAETEHQILNVDKLTYSGSLQSLITVSANPRYQFLQADICDGHAMRSALDEFRPNIVTHLAAELHVDRSIDAPANFIQTNIVGTFTLLSEALRYWQHLNASAKKQFRFHHVSTDEVFGSLGAKGQFNEKSAYNPHSPYSASKASSDHLVRAWYHTYGFPVLLTNCSNNYGPYQFPEKFMPTIMTNCVMGEPIPIYGTGSNSRDWLFVEDHVRALVRVFEAGRVGETYVIGGRAERKNIDVVRYVCQCLDRLRPRTDGKLYSELIAFVEDRPGHDQRYAVDPSKIERELGWYAQDNFESGVEKTIQWFIDSEAARASSPVSHYSGERMGLIRLQ